MTNSDNDKKGGLTYAQAGVDIDAGNAFVKAIKPHIKRTSRPGVMGSIGGFGGLFDLKATGYDDPVLVAANDGVGTKVKLAFETGIHNTVGIDLVAMCVNDLVVQGAEPLFFLDYFATGKLETGVAEKVVEGIATGCEMAGCALIGGETAEMPGMYAQGEYDLAGFSVGAVERHQILPTANIKAGDRLLGLYSSGPHSNGYSLIRKLVESKGYDWQDKAPFVAGEKISLGEALLTPTKIYVRSILKALSDTGGIKALAHITGGGLSENIPRVLPTGLNASIDLNKITPDENIASMFLWLAGEGNIAEDEMLKTFNCAIGMVVVVGQDEVTEIIDSFAKNGEKAVEIGHIETGENEPLVLYSGDAGFLS